MAFNYSAAGNILVDIKLANEITNIYIFKGMNIIFV
jgi:hypothetical protein